MCGLAGEVRLDGLPPDEDAVGRMAATMADRGPDGAGSWSRGRVALAHRRLKVIDLSEASRQPLSDPRAGLTVVLNGCVYNYRELRSQLAARGHRFSTSGDTEVVLKAYAEWGTDFVKHLVGMFALAVAEHDSGRVVLARDRLGIKPLYLATTRGAVRFASTLPALLAGRGRETVDTRLDPVALLHYLSFHGVVPPPRTVLAGVRKLPPATVRVLDPDGRSHDHRYWWPAFDRDPDRALWSERDWQDALLTALTRAVRRRTVADVPVGVLLSGGLDSSLMVALLAALGHGPTRTFSIGFEPVRGHAGDEFRYSDLVARTFGTDHERIEVTAEDLGPALSGSVRAMSEPMTSHDCVAFYLLGKVVGRQCRVVQTGQGADEVLGGYHWHQRLAGTGRQRGAEVYAASFLDRDTTGLAQLLDPDVLAAGLVEADPARAFVRHHFARPGARTAVDAALRLDTQVMLVDDPVKRVDNMTMAHGLEARVPFLDHEFVELAAACPPELKLAQGGKGVLKDIGRRLLPRSVVDRPKGYFPVPGLTYLEGDVLSRVRAAVTDPRAAGRGLFRAEHVAGLLAEPNARHTPLRGNELWQVAVLELWLQHHVDPLSG